MQLTFKFALSVIAYVEALEEKKKFIIARQLLRSGTSIGANVREAQNAESKRDFVHKLKIAMKEAEETEYWLQLCLEAESYPNPEKELKELESICKVLSKILKSSITQPIGSTVNITTIV